MALSAAGERLWAKGVYPRHLSRTEIRLGASLAEARPFCTTTGRGARCFETTGLLVFLILFGANISSRSRARLWFFAGGFWRVVWAKDMADLDTVFGRDACAGKLRLKPW